MKDIADFKGNPFFKESEFKCKCGNCNQKHIHKDLLNKLTTARKTANIPFFITSGCRCPEHNAKIGGVKNSDHLSNAQNICCGVDIGCTTDSNRYKLIKSLLDAGINRIGISYKFVHAGIDVRNPKEVIWFY